MNKNIKVMLLGLTLVFTMAVSAQEVDSLRYYLRIAAENNPAVRADFIAYQAALQKLPQAGAYEDPTLDMGFFFEPMDIIGGKQVADFTVMQMFPWFGTKKAARTEAEHMAKASYEKFRETRDMKFLEVYTQWYLLGSLYQKLQNNIDNKNLLEPLMQLAKRKFSSPKSGAASSSSSSSSSLSSSSTSSTPTSSFMGGMAMSSTTSAPTQSMSSMSGGSMSMGSGSSGMSDVLRIELEIVELESNIETILSEIKTEKAKFNALLNRPTNSVLSIPEVLTKVDYLVADDVINQIKSNNPMLEMLEQEALAYKAQGIMNKKMGYPMLGIGVQYMLNKKTNDPMFAMGNMNGKDMIMPMVSISIPIYRNKYKAQQKESQLWRQSTKEKYTETINSLETELVQVRHQLEDAERKTKLYTRQTEIAQTTYNLAVREFASGQNDLSSIIQIQRQLLDYKLKQTEAIASYNTLVATIQKMMSFTDIEPLIKE